MAIVISCLWALMSRALIRDSDMDAVIGMVLPDVGLWRALLLFLFVATCT